MFTFYISFAQEINTALELIDAGVTTESLTPLDVHALLRSVARIRDRIMAGNPYRPLIIHRYHPHDDLGGDFGLLNLDRQRVTQLIELGYSDAVAHDCVTSGCLLAGRRLAQPPQAAGVSAQAVVHLESSFVPP
jgi:hypothetical protein